MKKSIEGKEYWEKQIEKFKLSGLSRVQYCRDNAVNYDRFGYWLKMLSPSSLPTFVPVKVQPSEALTPNAILCTIEMRGHILKIHDLSALSFVMERLA